MDKTVIVNDIGILSLLIKNGVYISGLCGICMVGKRKVTKKVCSGKLKYHEEVCFIFMI